MSTLKGLLRELVGLFVDDGSLVAAIFAIVAVAAVLATRFQAVTAVAIVLSVGCLAALIENVIRTARKAARKP
jgi:hypothetical protein